MKISALKTATLLVAAIGFYGSANAVEPISHSEFVVVKLVDASSTKAMKHQLLAATHRPRTAEQERLIKEYMNLPPSQRAAFKAAHPDVQKSIWDYGPYAVCFYASVAGGADVVEAGEECHADWVK